jgi:hypothetical protein
MIAFRVSVNDDQPVTSGLHKGVSTVSVNVCRPHDPASEEGARVWYDVGGLDGPADEFLDWRRDLPLEPGDRLVLEVLDVTNVDAPRARRSVKDPPEGWTAEDLEEAKEPYDAEAAAQQREKLLEIFNRSGDFSLSRPESPVTALQVEINGETKVTAGVEKGVVVAMATFQSPPFGEKTGERWTCDFSLGGLDSSARRHFYWLSGDLDVGDVITITVVETTEIDTEVERGGPPKRINEALGP